MKRTIITAVSALIFCLGVNASAQQYKVIDPIALQEAIVSIDSTVNAIKASYDTTHFAETIDVPGFGNIGNITLQERVQGDEVWDVFSALCSAGDYKGAYEFHNSDGHRGNIMVHFRHSTPRYQFLVDVLTPMVREFEPEESVDSALLDLYQFEYAMEYITMVDDDGITGYVPESFPHIAEKLGLMLASRGMIEEALDTINPFAYAMEELSGNDAFTNFSVAIYSSSLYMAVGDVESTIQNLKEYKAYTLDNMDPDIDPEEYSIYLSMVDDALAKLEGK